MPTSTLFGGVPASLFAPLAAPDAAAYSGILADLYAESRRAAQPLSRALALDIIIHHTIASHTADDPLPAALETLRSLQDSGWVRLEVQPDFSQACALTPHAFQLLRLVNGDSPSVPELLITIYDLLKAALLDVDNEHRIGEAARLTDQLHDRLKELQHNADDTGTLPDTARLRAAVTDAASKLELRGHAPARRIRETFQSLDRILNDIAARRAQLAASSGHQPSAAAAQLAAILARLAPLDKKTFARKAESLINLYHRPDHPTTQPPNHPTTQPPNHPTIQPPNHLTTFIPDDTPAPEPSPDEIASARRAILQQFNRPISPGRVRRHAESILGGRPEVRAADLVAGGQADLPLLVQLRLHGDGSLGYRIEDGTWVETNGLGFRDFVMKNLNYVPPPEAEPSVTDTGEDESAAPAEEAPTE